MNIWNIVTGVATLISLIIAAFEFYTKRKLELFIKAILYGTAGNIAKIGQSTRWTDANLRDAQSLVVELPDSDIKKQIIKKISDGQGDATAADRLITNLFNEILSFQEAQFGTREIKHLERAELELAIKEKKPKNDKWK